MYCILNHVSSPNTPMRDLPVMKPAQRSQIIMHAGARDCIPPERETLDGLGLCDDKHARNL